MNKWERVYYYETQNILLSNCYLHVFRIQKISRLTIITTINSSRMLLNSTITNWHSKRTYWELVMPINEVNLACTVPNVILFVIRFG